MKTLTDSTDENGLQFGQRRNYAVYAHSSQFCGSGTFLPSFQKIYIASSWKLPFKIACYDRWYRFKKIHDAYREKPSLLYPELTGTLKFWEEENRRTYPPQKKKTLKQGENQEQTQSTSDTVTGGRRSLSPLSSSDPADKVY